VYISLRDRPAERTRTGKPPRVAPVVVTLGIVSLLTDVSSESVAAILPLFLTTVVGLSPVAYGFVDGLYQGVSALVRIAAGWASDRGDHPKWVAVCGYGLSMVARVGLVFAGGLTSIAAVVTADRIGKGVRTAPRDAMISASSDPAHLGRAFGVHRTLDTVGAALGPLIAFGVLWLVPDGFDVVMVVSLAFAVLGVSVLLLLVPDVRPRRGRGVSGTPVIDPAPEETAEPFRWKGAFTPGLVRLLVVGGGLALVTVGDGFLYLALLDRSEFATYWFPMLYVGTNLAYLALALPLGRVADRVGRARVLVLGHLALVAAYACAVLPVTGAVPTVITLFLLGAFYAATDGVLAAVAARTVPAAVRATGIAAAQTVVAVGRLVASATFGLLWFTVGPSRALLYVGGVLLVMIPVALVVLTRLDEADA